MSETTSKRIGALASKVIDGGYEPTPEEVKSLAESCLTQRPARTTDPADRLSRDLREAAEKLTPNEARFLVHQYYNMQEDRIRSAHRARTLAEGEKPHEVITWFLDRTESLEGQVRAALDRFSGAQPLGVWARSQVGIGPVIAAGLLAHVDLMRATSPSRVWRFAGMDPSVVWQGADDMAKLLREDGIDGTEEGVHRAAIRYGRDPHTLLRQMDGTHTVKALATALARRPWNGALKTLCWKIGESFVKVSGHDEAFYGKLYVSRKAQEVERNTRGDHARTAEAELAGGKRYGADTKARAAYEAGKLPDARVHARAKRWVVKLFLAHYWEVGYRLRTGAEPPKPYAVAHLGHVDVIKPPPGGEYLG